MKNNELKLLASLQDAISFWLDQNGDKKDFEALKCYVGDNISDHMASAAFAVLMSQVDLNRYFEEQGFTK